MSDEFLRDRLPETEMAETDKENGRFPVRNRLAALEKVMQRHPGCYTYVGGLAVRSGEKVYGPDGRDITPRPPDINL